MELSFDGYNLNVVSMNKIDSLLCVRDILCISQWKKHFNNMASNKKN